MIEAMFYFAGLAAALWLGIASADMLVSVIRREWRFSIRGAMVLTAMIALILGVLTTLVTK